MIVLLICAVVLFSVKNSFTSPLMVKLDANSDPALMPASENDMMTSIGGKTYKGYTLLIHQYMFNGQNLIIQYSMKHSNEISQSQWMKQSVKPTFELDPSTVQAVPGITTDAGVMLDKNGTINFTFNGTPPPDKFLLKINVNELILSDEQAQQHTLTGDWSFQLPVEKNYRLKANGQSEPL